MSKLPDVINIGVAQLAEALQNKDDLMRATHDFLRELAYRSTENALTTVNEIRQSHAEFTKRNEIRWQEGFDALETLIAVCIEAAQSFQKEFLAHERFQDDALLGVLMRIHARGCRTASEIVVLMKNGYPDGALSRWRTLHELAIAALVIAKVGKPAAIDYLISGEVKALEGMKEYQRCVPTMGDVEYTTLELERAQRRVDELLAKHGREADNYNGNFGWARPHVGSGQLDKVQEYAGMSHWSHDYKWASQDVHAGSRGLRAPLAMSETQTDLLLVGASNSGMIDPGHRTAISLSQITVTYLSAWLGDATSPLDSATTAFWNTLIDQLTTRVGQAFLQGEKQR